MGYQWEKTQYNSVFAQELNKNDGGSVFTKDISNKWRVR